MSAQAVAGFVPRVLTVPEAARHYRFPARTLRSLWESGQIQGRKVPGRGRTGEELRLFRPSLDAYFGG